MKNILFDLDGTLLPMDVEEFTQKYFGYIVQTMNNNNRDGKAILKAIGVGVDTGEGVGVGTGDGVGVGVASGICSFFT